MNAASGFTRFRPYFFSHIRCGALGSKSGISEIHRTQRPHLTNPLAHRRPKKSGASSWMPPKSWSSVTMRHVSRS
jgi:hypothetical protein